MTCRGADSFVAGSSIARTSATGLFIIHMRRMCTPSMINGLSVNCGIALRAFAVDVEGDVAVEAVVVDREAVAERREEREHHVAPLAHLEAAVLKVVDAGQVVGRHVLLRRVRRSGDAAAAHLVRVLARSHEA